MSVFDKLGRIRGVTWTWNEQAGPLGKEPGAADAGVIAQEVEAVFPELIVVGPEGYRRVNYSGLVGVVIEAVKELKAKNDALELRVVKLEQELELAKARADLRAPEGAPPSSE